MSVTELGHFTWQAPSGVATFPSAEVRMMDDGRTNPPDALAASPKVSGVAIVPPGDATLTRMQAAQALSVSERTIRRRTAAGQLTTTVDARGVRRYSATQIETMRRTTTTIAEADEGAIAAAVFRELQAGATPVSIVERLELAPSRVERLCADWARLRGGLWVSAEDMVELTARFGLDVPLGDGRHLLDELARTWPKTACAMCGTCPPTACAACVLRTTETAARQHAQKEQADRAEREARRERAEARALLRKGKP
jgi:hypothetical protein